MALRKKKYSFKELSVWIMMAICAILMYGAVMSSRSPGDTESAADKLEWIISKKLQVLDNLAQEALNGDYSEWMELKSVPEDIVIYRYVNDTLQSWHNQFPILNDDIKDRMMIQVLSNPRNDLISPLSYVTEDISYMSIGPKWYLMKSYSKENCKLITGLEIIDTQDDQTVNGINARFYLNKRFTINPLSFSGGSPVYAEGKPQFKLQYDSRSNYTLVNSYLVWLALAFFLMGMLIHLMTRRTMRAYIVTLIISSLLMATMYSWGRTMQNESAIFSPSLYADGQFLFSLGALVIINEAVALFICSTYIIRKHIFRACYGNKKRQIILLTFTSLTILAILLFVRYSFRSILLNSNIGLELYKLNDLSLFSLLVYLTTSSLLLMIPLLLQMSRPSLRELFSIRIHLTSNIWRVCLAVVFSAYLLGISSNLGFKKERNTAGVWSNILSIDRDISLEMQLKSIENDLANDIFVASLSMLSNSSTTILNRIKDSYLPKESQNYDISVYLLAGDNNSSRDIAFFNEQSRIGTPITSEGTRFKYVKQANGNSYYNGLFTFYSKDYGVAHMLLMLESKANKVDSGYKRILNYSAPGQVTLPPRYIYAKYENARLVRQRGFYSYSTLLEGEQYRRIYEQESSHFKENGYTHFVNRISETEAIVISRPSLSFDNYLMAIMFMILVFYFSTTLLTTSLKNSAFFRQKNYYKVRVASTLTLSLVLTLVIMASVSIIFVYRRNDDNRMAMMSEKISALQSLVQEWTRNANSYLDLMSPEYSDLLESAGEVTNEDITLYTTEGKAFLTTNPDIFDKMLLGGRINQDAYRSIVYEHRHYFFNKEKIQDEKFDALYSPIYNSNGDMIAILSSPYVEDNYDFQMDAAAHLVTILSVFLILLILARALILGMVKRMFEPLIEMGHKMSAQNVDDLEYIVYEGEDEISSLVKSYNRMVNDLSDSSKKLAQVERDKAWSGMARQVAHEIKNPLTPMKLQLQRLVRLKQKNAPDWQEKFDEVAKVVLDHIDVLSDTANEFSTFAKLYSEEHTLLNLDKMIKEEIAMYDNKDNIEFVYMGFNDAMAMGPKPQLTRVFVNLINNAIQAIEISQQESIDAGQEPKKGRIIISLRQSSSKENHYDLVFEDNGPGVSEENQDKLFTPNFTTKSSGTGLGLAISRSILERCSAEIVYSRSFSMGGACFTIVFPKSI